MVVATPRRREKQASRAKHRAVAGHGRGATHVSRSCVPPTQISTSPRASGTACGTISGETLAITVLIIGALGPGLGSSTSLAAISQPPISVHGEEDRNCLTRTSVA
jgi:hypothetical protein